MKKTLFTKYAVFVHTPVCSWWTWQCVLLTLAGVNNIPVIIIVTLVTLWRLIALRRPDGLILPKFQFCFRGQWWYSEDATPELRHSFCALCITSMCYAGCLVMAMQTQLPGLYMNIWISSMKRWVTLLIIQLSVNGEIPVVQPGLYECILWFWTAA